ncbi:glycerophosphodiester phosphodiesterase [Clostridium perfringens]|uniref:glycerophosphodiester phosphodiesterase n=1 Tax=Clostridium perfringens TaxID=1502 RepID=UPI0018D78F7C|nr:glycerophosphodiester phosphodiesterase [Clostridium perfringens]MCR1962283.1 glycerophosphodiester phosphodiesterase [Clostridium perfringens]MDB2046402.1 glycerophosphodiester phosphodiesterase [Clostridium perfringens]MDB2057650.1 glycerophosphodiester phosphodiesterase [Clostridium perfringens]QPR50586.1 glycerophosphodiester phosphodiesterase [Clostridium perfringens]
MKVFAHRGFSYKYPENTLLAFKEALKLDIYGIELDVHKSKDGKLVIIHDEDIKRTFKGEGKVKDYTLEELRNFKCNKEGFENNDDCKISLLEDVFNLIKDKDIVLNIEIKNDVIDYENIEKDVLDLIKEYNLERKILISSFNHKALEKVKKLNGDIKLGVLYEKEMPNILDIAKSLNAYAIHPAKSLVSEELVEKAHNEGVKVNVYTVNEKEDIDKLKNYGVDAIFTDQAKMALEYLK